MNVELFEKCILTAFTLIEMNRRVFFQTQASLECCGIVAWVIECIKVLADMPIIWPQNMPLGREAAQDPRFLVKVKRGSCENLSMIYLLQIYSTILLPFPTSSDEYVYKMSSSFSIILF